jgi:pyruvate formate lyase activating enzyme
MDPVIFDIARGSLSDGPGIRTVVFFQGCPLRCLWCHNPESQSMEKEVSGRLRVYSEDELMEILMRDTAFYAASGGGVTFSGGEPLMHMEYLRDICRHLKKNNVSVAFDTSGYFDFEQFERTLADHTDLMLFDLKIIDDQGSVSSIGSSSSLILENLRRLVLNTIIHVMIRIPAVPGFVLTDENIRDIGLVLRQLRIRSFDLVPYNPSFFDKLKKLGLSPDHRLSLSPLCRDEERSYENRIKAFLETP